MRILRNKSRVSTVALVLMLTIVATLMTCLSAVNASGLSASVNQALEGTPLLESFLGALKLTHRRTLLSAIYPASLSYSTTKAEANLCVNWAELCEGGKTMEKEAKGRSFGGRKRLALVEGQKETKHKSVNNVRKDRRRNKR